VRERPPVLEREVSQVDILGGRNEQKTATIVDQGP
jgi:hypothetical protein